MLTLRLEFIELVIALLTVISLIVILIDIFFPLNAEQKRFIYVFDLVVVLILLLISPLECEDQPRRADIS